MDKNVKDTKQSTTDRFRNQTKVPASPLPSSMKPCSNCGEPIMQSANSCIACGAYQIDKGNAKG